MEKADTVPLLARWIAELQCDRNDLRQERDQLQHRVLYLEHHIRTQAIARRHWIRNGHRERV